MEAERDTERYLKAVVESGRGICLKFPPLFFRGFPDRILLLSGGLCVFVELKAPNENPTPLQLKVHKRLRGLGFRCEVLRSRDEIDIFMLTL